MKLLSDVLQIPEETNSIVCDYVMTPNGLIKTDPFLSTQKECDWCGGKRHYCPLVDPASSSSHLWLCANSVCSVYNAISKSDRYTPTPEHCRAILWPKFCELNNIGDIHHKVKFEDINQSPKKIEYMLKYVASPKGFVVMQGDPGTGKTFAAMGMCELFTRKSSLCVFTTQRQLLSSWVNGLNSVNGDQDNFINRVRKTNLLVIDDFGIGEFTGKFLEFFMDLVNDRMQWNNRGTIITTNLDNKKFASFCGNALSDRINTGQQLVFTGKSRRKQVIF